MTTFSDSGNSNSGPQLSPEFDPPLRECPMCKSRAICHQDHDYKGRQIGLCRQCKLMFMNPQYTDQYLTAYYARYGDEFDVGNGTGIIIGDPDDQSRRSAAKADIFRFLSHHCSPGRLLSIGCFDGIELLLAERFGWKPEGFDVDDVYMTSLRNHLDYPIYSGDFFGLGLHSNHYDCIVMDQVLEHPKNPQEYLEEICRILKPDGVLYIGCPNIKSVSNRLKTVLGKLGLKRRRGRHYDMFHHLFFYDPKTLSHILTTYYGYEVVAVEGEPLAGLKTTEIKENWRTRWSNYIRRRFPLCESSFRLLARKPKGQSFARRAAA